MIEKEMRETRIKGWGQCHQVRFFIPLRYIQNDKSACHSEEGTTEESRCRQL
jgi:hypothetical protein